MEVTQIRQISKDKIRIYNKAINYLSYKPRTEYEVRQRLLKYCDKAHISDPEDLITQVISELTDADFINDLEYAKEFYSSKLNRKTPDGPRKISLALYKRGISKTIIKDVVQPLPEQETAAAIKIVKKKFEVQRLSDLSGREYYDYLARIKRYLYQKGFSSSCINSVVDTITKVH